VRWVLLNASPDVRVQLDACSALHPRGLRDAAVVAVVLSSGELDHCLGLLSLREARALAVHATPAVADGFRRNAMARALDGRVTWCPLALAAETAIVDVAGLPTGLVVEARPVPGRVPRHLAGTVPPSDDDVVALRVRDATTAAVLVYCPCAARVDDAVRAALSGADVVFFDGTFWTSDELVQGGLGTQRAEEMAHAPVGGAEGSLARLEGVAARRRILTHLNNTNPLLREDGVERAIAAERGWEIAHDGMELFL
jgi:pyrroloquinoline quinone biosynthesis protein B